jgi:hypothetical protein
VLGNWSLTSWLKHGSGWTLAIALRSRIARTHA